MSVFEAMMVMCFGAAWPVSIAKSYRSRRNSGKSVVFLCIVLTGYISGILHKVHYNMDQLVWLYVLNACMVATDIGLYIRNWRLVRTGAIEVTHVRWMGGND